MEVFRSISEIFGRLRVNFATPRMSIRKSLEDFVSTSERRRIGPPQGPFIFYEVGGLVIFFCGGGGGGACQKMTHGQHIVSKVGVTQNNYC